MLPYTAILPCTRMISHKNRSPAKQKAFLRIHPVLAGPKYWVGCLLNVIDIRKSYSQRCRCVLARWELCLGEWQMLSHWSGAVRVRGHGRSHLSSPRPCEYRMVTNGCLTPASVSSVEEEGKGREWGSRERAKVPGLEKLTFSGSSLLGCHIDNICCKGSWETHAKDL